MTATALRPALIACSSLAALAASACATPQSQPLPVAGENPMGWLAGCWRTEDGAFREVWSVDGNKHLFGHNTFRQGSDPGTVVFFEQMRLVETGGTWTFSAYPNGVGPSDFPQTSARPDRAEFTNPAHDFPQRVTYQRDGAALNAEIMTLDGERSQSWTFVPCGTAPPAEDGPGKTLP
ncbi:MAG: DUF6265 family protein [Pseudomonadota bacterium]